MCVKRVHTVIFAGSSDQSIKLSPSFSQGSSQPLQPSLDQYLPDHHLPSHVSIYEVGPRDGLQNESTLIPMSTKLELIHGLAAAGLKRIETTSFVSARKVPQLADAADLMNILTREQQKPVDIKHSLQQESVTQAASYSVLVPNLKVRASCHAVLCECNISVQLSTKC